MRGRYHLQQQLQAGKAGQANTRLTALPQTSTRSTVFPELYCISLWHYRNPALAFVLERRDTMLNAAVDSSGTLAVSKCIDSLPP